MPNKLYEPELGQMCFGQPWQEIECPDNIESALSALMHAWDCMYPHRDAPNPFGNTGSKYVFPHFRVESYNWGDDEQEFNFAWRDLRVSWYKYFGRGLAANKTLSRLSIKEMLKECLRDMFTTPEPINWPETEETTKE